ncbi:hypothetical protein ASPSYDRAFT_93459 [Aspergillus sydowii CBS 593.65]|uniref:Zn(2)-C6 fungal-type domain-containing protein n=1 Tax=Aspergillus sydowii CBS 593.65 TaxID=1036612 RepID=A0A1L9T5A1_9EURO|nr:uncharacterized protein ASPSYDRAFT_93459 [Aspergillus sydowii CBS 593.65]OJJ54541.1 hypothetical protein ASPSYDRAFT_93459 [Aspergillus sydowii CBS 593.65]
MQSPVPGREPGSRRSTACDACFHRKIKCDSTKPRCNWCYHRQVDCTYDRHRSDGTVRRKASAGKRRNLIDRIRHIDQLRAESKLGDDPPPAEEVAHTARQSANPSKLLGPIQLLPSPRIIHFAGWKIGNISPDRGSTPTLLPEGIQWIQSRTGTTVPFPTVHYAPWEKSKPSHSLSVGIRRTSTRRLELPPRPVLNRYLDAYWSSAIHALFPVIDSSLFSQTIDTAYLASQGGAHNSSRACIFALLGLVSGVDYPRAQCTAPTPPNIPRDDYILEAQRLLPSIICEGFNLDALQATVILAVLGVMTGELQNATHYVSISSRSIIAVGVHTMGDPVQELGLLSSDSDDIRIRKHIRNLFWICYVLDKDISLRTGQSHCLRDEDCNLQLPVDYTKDLFPRMTYSAPLNAAEGPLFPVELNLSLIKSRIFTALYSYQGLQKSDAEIIRLIRELDDEIERWRLSMPSELRPTLSYGKDDAHKHPSRMTMYLVIVHLNYYFCINIVHLAGSRCESWRSACSSPGMMDGLKSSLTLSVEASRSLLCFLKDAENSISTGSFWSLLFYPMSAVLTLFCNLLANPDASTAADDAYLLVVAEHTTERVFLRQISEIDQAAHIQAITGFISSVRNIAQQAIKK